MHAAAITFDELTWDETLDPRRSRPDSDHSLDDIRCVAGTASGVTDFSPGDEVYGLIRFDRDGAAAEYVAVPGADLAVRPTTVSHIVSPLYRWPG